MGKAVFRSSATIQKYLKAQRESGLTAERFCKRRHLAISTFWNWKRRFKQHDEGKLKEKEARFVKLVPVDISAPPSMEISTGPFKINIPGNCDERFIRRVLSVAADLCSSRRSDTNAS